MVETQDVEKALADWKVAVQGFGVTSGPVTAAFQDIHRTKFKECEVVIVGSARVGHVLNQLIKLFESGSRVMRWRAAYLMGEVIRLHSQEKGKQKAVNLLLKSLQEAGFRVRSPEGIEVVSALGKSEDARASTPLLKALNDRWQDAAVVPQIFVSLGKVGDVETVTALSRFMSKPNLTKSAEIFLPWAMGMLGRLECSRSGFPISRQPFLPGLKQLQRVVESTSKQLEQQRNAIYAIGRICDQRRTVPRPQIELSEPTINAVKQLLEQKRARLNHNGPQALQMMDLALAMIEGSTLSADQCILLEKIETILLVKVEEGGPVFSEP